MALYIGSQRSILALDGIVYLVNTLLTPLNENNALLISLDDYVLVDSSGCYLIAQSQRDEDINLENYPLNN